MDKENLISNVKFLKTLKKNEKCFFNDREQLTLIGRIQHSIELIKDKITFVNPQSMGKIIKEQISDMLNQGILT